ncbi:MAG: AmmeMemoRadiSam system radical SAM enzyme [Caldisericaceae bacterium]
MDEALMYDKLSDNRVQCNLCNFRCIIPEGKSGFCKVRVNKGGVLYTLLDSFASSVAVDPIEKKPLFHFHPGSLVLSFGTWGCNFRCRGCQNYDISRFVPSLDKFESVSKHITPKEAVEMALAYGASGIAWTYNEPTIWFEYTLETAKLAKEKGLYTVYVTNGSITEEALDVIGPFLDAFRVDIKAFSEDSYRKITPIFDWRKILETTAYAKTKWNMHIEVVTNVIPGINDNPAELRGLAKWIRETLGKKTPWHLTRFYPYLDLSNFPPTPVEELEKLHDIGIEEGLNFVYVGNIMGHPYEDTYCPKCKRRVIKRNGFEIVENHTHNGKCDFCGESLEIVE